MSGNDMIHKLSEINEIIGGQLIGDGDIEITNVSSIGNASQGTISFVKDRRYVKQALESAASALIVPFEIADLRRPQIVVDDPYLSFVEFLNVVATEKQRQPEGIHAAANIGSNVRYGKGISIGANAFIGGNVIIGDNVTIYPHVFIGDRCEIGDDTVIHANVSIREEVIIGKRVLIHSGTMIGGDGFGYLQVGGKHVKIPQVGTVDIADDVEIGANVTIDRAMLDKTVVKRGVKIDNHSHVAHNVIIGEDSMLIGFAKIAGSTIVGKNVMIAEDVGITDNVTIGDNCMIGGGSKVYKSLKANSIVWGAPAKPLRLEKKIQASLKKLPQMWTSLRIILKKLGIDEEAL